MKENYPTIGIYCGKGASHSWLWFVDLMEKFKFFDLNFLDENDISNGKLKGLDVLVISGGDTFALAKYLGPQGAGEIEKFVKEGGLYIGSCAGAYLPMHSSKKFLKDFNFVRVKITNLTKTLPPARRMLHKYYICYGCRYVFHPVRGEVKIKLHTDEELVAPIFGGPGMEVQDESCSLGWYSGFTANTLFLTDMEVAQKTFLGKSAIVRCCFEKGKFYLFGPHLEHPRYAKANEYVINLINSDCRKRERDGEKNSLSLQRSSNKLLRELKREVSNSRIVAYSMEHKSILWKIGEKTYEPQKIIVFLEYLWKRTLQLGRFEKISLCVDTAKEMEDLVFKLKEVTHLIRILKKEVKQKKDSTKVATKLIFNLLKASKSFFNAYFFILKQKRREHAL